MQFNSSQIDLISRAAKELVDHVIGKIGRALNPAIFIRAIIIRIFMIPAPLFVFIHNTYKKFTYFLFERKYYDENLFPSEDTCHSANKLIIVVLMASRLVDNPSVPGLKFFQNQGFEILIIIQLDSEVSTAQLAELNDFGIVVMRKNYGFDFGAYKHALKMLSLRSQESIISEVILLNDSVYFPARNPGKLFAWMETDYEFGASVMNYDKSCGHLSHTQSFFMHFKGEGIQWMLDFFERFTPYSSKNLAIERGEVGIFSDAITQDNIRISSFVDLFAVPANERLAFISGNPTHRFVQRLNDLDFPFLKYDLVTKNLGPLEFIESVERMPNEYQGTKLLKSFFNKNYSNLVKKSLLSKLFDLYGLN